MAATAIQIPRLTIPAAGPSTIGIYPTSPLAQFPPPVPVLRTPLRERCGFTAELSLTIKTSFGQQQACSGSWSPKGHIQPHRSHLPRRRKAQIKRIVFYDDEPEQTQPPAPAPGAFVPPPKPADEPCLQEAVPGLFVAFKTESTHPHDASYTHIIDVCYPLPGYDAGATEQAYQPEGRVHRLRLVLPEASKEPPVRAGLALTEAQLRAARDFLAQALPYGSAAQQSVATRPAADKQATRVLISTPPRRPTDAMSIVGCYLAFASRKSVDTALRCIDDEPEFLSVWKGEVSEDEVARVERVARMWSWLSGIRR
ncbi:uncharacterized protein C8Q71DRAFT_154935 [Rhodofomes roseus]|uniref:Uncharacterized protein n=1 Tax=Rhodofomes roseus TaxID=34475 RepID=A0ABQ8K9K4_9APHY|nr:uncharacterized protein C8Q71DRAFT_154935 [Rhodofomes roseus]KAH9833978.1 hypothetical protein C8Q71DRAFT_154935 [Rhodofomes roseus]